MDTSRKPEFWAGQMAPLGLPMWPRGKESACQCRRCRFDPCIRKIPGVGNGPPLQCSCLENSMDHLADCSSWGCKESDTSEGLSMHAWVGRNNWLKGLTEEMILGGSWQEWGKTHVLVQQPHARASPLIAGWFIDMWDTCFSHSLTMNYCRKWTTVVPMGKCRLGRIREVRKPDPLFGEYL